MQEIGSLFAQFWHIFEEIDVPILNIKFSTLYLGVFAVSFSLLILRPILGIGGGLSRGIAGLGKSAKSRLDRPSNNSRKSFSDNSWTGTMVTQRNNNVIIHHRSRPMR